MGLDDKERLMRLDLDSFGFQLSADFDHAAAFKLEYSIASTFRKQTHRLFVGQWNMFMSNAGPCSL